MSLPGISTGHVGLNVTDLDRSTDFYRQLFGYELLQRSDDAERPYVFLGWGEELVLTLWEQAGSPFAGDRAGLHHLSFQVESVEQLQTAARLLRELGAPIHHGGLAAHAAEADSGGLFFEDPDGTRLEIYCGAGLMGHDAPYGAAPTCGFF